MTATLLVEELAGIIWRKRRELQAEWPSINLGSRSVVRNSEAVVRTAAPFALGSWGKGTDIRDLVTMAPEEVEHAICWQLRLPNGVPLYVAGMPPSTRAEIRPCYPEVAFAEPICEPAPRSAASEEAAEPRSAVEAIYTHEAERDLEIQWGLTNAAAALPHWRAIADAMGLCVTVDRPNRRHAFCIHMRPAAGRPFTSRAMARAQPFAPWREWLDAPELPNQCASFTQGRCA